MELEMDLEENVQPIVGKKRKRKIYESGNNPRTVCIYGVEVGISTGEKPQQILRQLHGQLQILSEMLGQEIPELLEQTAIPAQTIPSVSRPPPSAPFARATFPRPPITLPNNNNKSLRKKEEGYSKAWFMQDIIYPTLKKRKGELKKLEGFPIGMKESPAPLPNKEHAESLPSSNSAGWFSSFEELKAFKQLYGHTNVSRKSEKYRDLALWVRQQRRRKKIGKLNQNQIKLLESIDFEWEKASQTHSQRQLYTLLRKKPILRSGGNMSSSAGGLFNLPSEDSMTSVLQPTPTETHLTPLNNREPNSSVAQEKPQFIQRHEIQTSTLPLPKK